MSLWKKGNFLWVILLFNKAFSFFFFFKYNIGGNCSCIFTSSCGISTLGISGINYLNSVPWNQFNKSFTKGFLKGCPDQGTTDLQSLRDNIWSYKLIVGSFFTEFCHICFVKQDSVIELAPDFAFALLLLFGLTPRFFHWIFVFIYQVPSMFLLVVLGQHSETGRAAATH